MNKFRKAYFFALLYIAILTTTYAQPVAIGQWREHLPYEKGISVSRGNSKVFCATTGGLFSLNEQDYSIDRLTRVTGLSDISINKINFNSYNNVLVIGYKNGNIDLIRNNTIINISDIKSEQDIGDKTINNIYFINQYAYLACGFGIVVIDTERDEVKDTYKIGPGGAYINVYDVATDGTNIYASTEAGIYKALLSDPNLVYFGAWSKMSGIPNGTYNTLAVFQGNLFANYSKNIASGAYLEDTVFAYNISSSTWSKMMEGPNVIKDNIKSIRVSQNKMYMCNEWYISVYDNTLSRIKVINNYGYTNEARPREAIADNSGVVWIADYNYSLVKFIDNGNAQYYYPNGPRTSNVVSLAVSGGELWCAPGGVGDAYHNLYNIDGVSSFINGTWNTIHGQQQATNMDTTHDILDITIDPNNTKHVFACSYRAGLLEFNNGALVNFYNETNSSLSSRSEYYWIGASGSAYDGDKNIWVTNSNVATCLSVKKSNGTWQAFNFSGFGVNGSTSVGDVYITRSGQKWMLMRGNGIIVYNDEGTFAQPNANNTKKIGIEAGKGALPSNAVMCVAEDNDGELWVGTDKGVAVFYSPEAIFTSSNWDSQQILIEQDGHIQKLLETETVNTIAIDGANRKWIGTQNSGVYLISEDGTKEILHFTTANSPLLSNEISTIAIDGISGEVFIGTSNGIISYRSTATEGLEDYTDVYAFPNPVREGYEGPIAIKGLVTNADVKITDISGGLVYSTKALGGQAIWDGKNFNGQKVSTGVYLVFCSNDDGSKTFITKILFIN